MTILIITNTKAPCQGAFLLFVTSPNAPPRNYQNATKKDRIAVFFMDKSKKIRNIPAGVLPHGKGSER